MLPFSVVVWNTVYLVEHQVSTRLLSLNLFLEHWIISQESLLDEMGHMLDETELDVKKLDEVG